MTLIKILIPVLFLLSCILVRSAVPEMPNHNIVVFDLVNNNGQYKITNPQVIADSPGYDNQPYFSDDSKNIYFTRIENHNADLWLWSQQENKATNITRTPLSEYSPTPIPFDNNSLSTVVVEKDGTQRLWKYSSDHSFSKIFETIQPVGYHVWSGENIGLFILGEPHTLQVTRLGQEKSKIVDSNIGRCLQKIPGQNRISYTVIAGKNNGKETHRLKSYEFSSGEIKEIKLLPNNSQDYVWLDSDNVISSNGNTLLLADINSQSGWKKLTNSSNFKLTGISRLAISADKKRIAVVFVEP